MYNSQFTARPKTTVNGEEVIDKADAIAIFHQSG
eukprot:SAG11_NODE_3057_length_2722_cov_2.016012_1_plen_33_part_10